MCFVMFIRFLCFFPKLKRASRSLAKTGFAGADAGGYIFGCFLVFVSGCFLGIVFRVPRAGFLAFGCLLGSPGGSPGRHFSENFDNFPILGWL